MVVRANTSVFQLILPITNDDIPELDESLTVQLVNVSGGALIGDHTQVTVTILTNDDAYGLLGFAEVCSNSTFFFLFHSLLLSSLSHSLYLT